MNHKRLLLALALPFAFVPCAGSQEKLPPGAKVTRLEVTPNSVDLKHRFEYTQLLVTGTLDSGEQVDLTRIAQVAVPDKVVKVSANGQVRPIANGTGEIKFTA